MFKKLAIAAAIFGAGTAAANAALVYPTSVISADQNGTTVAASRSHTSAALLSADSKFYSLGLGGSIVLYYAGLMTGTGLLTEVTFGSAAKYPESVDLYTSYDGITWSSAISVANTAAVSGTTITTSALFHYVKLVDTTPASTGGDGFDLGALGFTPVVPLPASGLVLASGLAGLAALRRRKKSA